MRNFCNIKERLTLTNKQTELQLVVDEQEEFDDKKIYLPKWSKNRT
jgi:hypothetical protein